MRIIFAFVVFTSCLALSSGTLKLFKPKLKGAPLIYPVAKYRTVKYLSSVNAVPEAAAYTHPIFVSTYSVSSPSVATYAAPIQTVSVPSYAYASTYVAPVDIHPRPVKIAYNVFPIGPETVYNEPVLSYSTPIIEGHYSI